MLKGDGAQSYQKTSVSSSSMLQKTEIYEHIQVNDLHYCSSKKIKDVWTDTECYFDVKHC
jgi:hypothetical protein